MKCKYCRARLPDNANYCEFCGGRLNDNTSTDIKNESTNAVANDFQNRDFYMTIDDVFMITGRGTVITGIIEQGEISVGDFVEISMGNKAIRAKVEGIEVFKNSNLTTAKAGDEYAGGSRHVGLLLSKVKRTEVCCGQIVRKIKK